MGVVCLCNNIDRDELIKVIKSGANTLEAVKKATRLVLGTVMEIVVKKK